MGNALNFENAGKEPNMRRPSPNRNPAKYILPSLLIVGSASLGATYLNNTDVEVTTNASNDNTGGLEKVVSRTPQLYNLDFVNDKGEIEKEKYSVNSSGVIFHIDGVEVPLTNYELFNNVLSPNPHTDSSTCALVYRLKDAQDPTITASFNGFEDILNTYNCNKN